MKRKLLLLTAFLIMGIVLVKAQDGCAALLKGAVETTRVVCVPIESDQVCYGSRDAAVEAASQVEFSKPGNLVSVAEVESLETRMVDDSYGMVYVRTQAYALDSWEAQEITLLLYGDVSIENRGQEGITVKTLDLTVSDANGANVRATPSTDAEIIGQLIIGETVKATGRLADNPWLRIVLPEGGSGWVFSGAVTISGDLTILPEVTPDDLAPEKLYRPLQAFEFETAVEDAPCAEAPDSGILIQSPEGVGEVELEVNDIRVLLAGTLHLQMRSDSQFSIDIIEGSAQIEIEGSWLSFESGTGVLLPAADDEPVVARPYDYERLYMLPVSLLPRSIMIVVRPETFIIPATPGVDPLAGLTPESPCTVAASTNVNLRAGPGSNYGLRRGGMKTGESAHPDGKATDSDGRVWWRLVPHVWVSSNAVYALGACYALPSIEIPPS